VIILHINPDSEVPIYLQVAYSIEDDILKGIFKKDSQIPSTTEISLRYRINPATVAKGYNMLVNDGVIYKKRGLGMFVCAQAKDKLIKKRKKNFYDTYVKRVIEEAEKINISIKDVIKMLERSVEK
jgi:DNA-binding transcriptional regulator YhcF (GntR family)